MTLRKFIMPRRYDTLYASLIRPFAQEPKIPHYFMVHDELVRIQAHYWQSQRSL
jgi:hypothetical protein